MAKTCPIFETNSLCVFVLLYLSVGDFCSPSLTLISTKLLHSSYKHFTNLYPEREGYEHLANAKQLLTSAQGCKDCHLLLSFVKVTHGPANLGQTVTEDSFESMPIKLSSTRI